jgi:hypothetical protein
MIIQSCMKTITDVSIPDGIILSEGIPVFTGPPNSLCGFVGLENKTDELIKIRNQSLFQDTDSIKNKFPFSSVPLSIELFPGEAIQQLVRIITSRKTPPGTYDGESLIFGKKRKLKFIVLPLIEIDIKPNEVNFVGIRPQLSHEADIQVSNQGNVPLLLPSGEQEIELSDKIILKCLVQAIKGKKLKDTPDTLSSFYNKVRQALDSAVRISFIPEKQISNPGDITYIRLVIKFPGKLKQDTTYEGEIVLFNETVKYRIIPSAGDIQPL